MIATTMVIRFILHLDWTESLTPSSLDASSSIDMATATKPMAHGKKEGLVLGGTERVAVAAVLRGLRRGLGPRRRTPDLQISCRAALAAIV